MSQPEKNNLNLEIKFTFCLNIINDIALSWLNLEPRF